MFKPCWFLNESSGTRDTGLTKNANKIEIEIEIKGGKGEPPHFTSPNSPREKSLDFNNEIEKVEPSHTLNTLRNT